MKKIACFSGITKTFRTSNGTKKVLNNIGFELFEGQVAALVGRSGAGKTTLLHIIAGLSKADQGNGWFRGKPLGLTGTRRAREAMAIVFQDPYSSLPPHFRVIDIVLEAMKLRGHFLANYEETVVSSLSSVGLDPPRSYLYRYPGQLSGGQRQRVALARALVTNPALLIADEPVSMLDVSVGVEILNLIRMLAQKGMAVLLTMHDLAMACYVADRLLIMEDGTIARELDPRRLLQSDRILRQGRLTWHKGS